jgi:hypothetical protein
MIAALEAGDENFPEAQWLTAMRTEPICCDRHAPVVAVEHDRKVEQRPLERPPLNFRAERSDVPVISRINLLSLWVGGHRSAR